MHWDGVETFEEILHELREIDHRYRLLVIRLDTSIDLPDKEGFWLEFFCHEYS